jgi:signal peptidase
MLTRERAFKITLLVLLAALIVIIVMHLSREAPAAIVKGRSMLPLLREGDIVFIVACKPNEIGVGDIVVFRSNYGNRLVIHRVIGVVYENGKYYYITKGDNNVIPDYSEFDYGIGVNQARVIGKVFSINDYILKIPYIGNLALVFRGD